MHFHSAPDGFLVAANLVGPTAMASTRSEEEFTVRLKTWVPEKNLFTNGLILEIIHKFGLKGNCGAQNMPNMCRSCVLQ